MPNTVLGTPEDCCPPGGGYTSEYTQDESGDAILAQADGTLDCEFVSAFPSFASDADYEANYTNKKNGGRYFNTDTGTLRVCNGGVWADVSGGGPTDPQFVKQATAPTDTNVLWIDNTDAANPIIKCHDGSGWLSTTVESVDPDFVKQSTAPTDTNVLWIDNTDAANPVFKCYDGSSWISIAGSLAGVTSSAPGPGTAGNFAALNATGHIDKSFIDAVDTFTGSADTGKAICLNANGEINKEFINTYPRHSSETQFLSSLGRPPISGDRFFNTTYFCECMYNGIYWVIKRQNLASLAFHNTADTVPTNTAFPVPYNIVNNNLPSGGFVGTTGEWTAPFTGLITINWSYKWGVPTTAPYGNNSIERDFSIIQRFTGGAWTNTDGGIYYLGDTPTTGIGGSIRVGYHYQFVLAGDKIRAYVSHSSTDPSMNLDPNTRYNKMIIRYAEARL